MSVKDKVLTRLEIPPEFAQMMLEVSKRIDANDEATTIESDDLLQWPDCYGGLCEADRKMFGFAYFPEPARDVDDPGPDVEWGFYFSADEIRAIGNREVTEVDMWRCNPDCADRFWTPQSYCSNCDTGPVPEDWGL